MSLQYCNYCQREIDTDFDAEHFDCSDAYECTEEEQNEDYFNKH